MDSIPLEEDTFIVKACFNEPERDGSVDESRNLRSNCGSQRWEALPQAISDHLLYRTTSRLPTKATNTKHLCLWLARLYFFFRVSVTTDFKEWSELK